MHFFDQFDGTAIALDGKVTFDRPTGVPEPGWLVLFGAALPGLAIAWHRIKFRETLPGSRAAECERHS